MIIIADGKQANEICNWLNQRMPGVSIIGEVRAHGHKVSHIHPDVVFQHY